VIVCLPNALKQLPNVIVRLPNALGISPNAISRLPKGLGIFPKAISRLPKALGIFPNAFSRSKIQSRLGFLPQFTQFRHKFTLIQLDRTVFDGNFTAFGS